jgi:hypothetical protein
MSPGSSRQTWTNHEYSRFLSLLMSMRVINGMRIKSRIISLFVLAALTGCNLPASGLAPAVWMDRPLDGETFPLAPLTLQAHAADADGVVRIEFLVFDLLVGEVETGGTRLEEASLQWKPDQAGTYMVSARAVDSQDNEGISTPLEITVGVKESISVTSSPAPGSDATTGTPTPIPPESSPTRTITRTATITPGIPIIIIPPPTIIVDNTPPEITLPSAVPTIISAKIVCGETPAITTISASVTDEVGLQSVTARIMGTGTSLMMSPVGGNVYEVVLGPFDEATTLMILILASDTSGNNSQAGPLTIQVIACPG